MNDHLDELHNTVHSTDKSPFKSDKVKKLWKLVSSIHSTFFIFFILGSGK